jgi:hypothetical protein
VPGRCLSAESASAPARPQPPYSSPLHIARGNPHVHFTLPRSPSTHRTLIPLRPEYGTFCYLVSLCPLAQPCLSWYILYTPTLDSSLFPVVAGKPLFRNYVRFPLFISGLTVSFYVLNLFGWMISMAIGRGGRNATAENNLDEALSADAEDPVT